MCVVYTFPPYASERLTGISWRVSELLVDEDSPFYFAWAQSSPLIFPLPTLLAHAHSRVYDEPSLGECPPDLTITQACATDAALQTTKHARGAPSLGCQNPPITKLVFPSVSTAGGDPRPKFYDKHPKHPLPILMSTTENVNHRAATVVASARARGSVHFDQELSPVPLCRLLKVPV